MSVRKANEPDQSALHELYAAFFLEIETPAYWGVTLEAELTEVDEILADGRVALRDTALRAPLSRRLLRTARFRREDGESVDPLSRGSA